MMRLGEEGVRQGAEERSSLLSKLLFSRQTNWPYIYNSTCKHFFAFNRYQGRCKGSVSEKGKMKSPFRLGWFLIVSVLL